MVARTTSGGWIISHRCSCITVYVFCRNAQSESHSDPHDICTLSLLYQLPNCNLFTQHVLFILWRDTSSELWTPVQLLLHCYYRFTFTRIIYVLAYYYLLPLDKLYPLFTASGEIDNLIVSWGKVLGCVVCRFHIAAR
jgi:hypothetical protein